MDENYTVVELIRDILTSDKFQETYHIKRGDFVCEFNVEITKVIDKRGGSCLRKDNSRKY